MLLDIYTALALALLRPTFALPDYRPTQTPFVDLTGNLLGFSPKPTGFVNKRDAGFFGRRATSATPGSVCGYISGNVDNAVTCESSAYCATNRNLGVFGCCNYYSALSNGDFTYSGCAFQSRCYDSTAAGNCIGTCASNTLNGFCTQSRYPYCQTFSLTELGVSAYYCNTIPNYTVELLLTPTTSFSVTSQSQGPTVGVVTVTVGPSASASADGGTLPVDNNNSNNKSGSGKSSVVGPAVGGAIGGLAVVLIAAGGAFWLRMKHKKTKGAAAAGAAVGGTDNNNNTTTGSGAGPGPLGGSYHHPEGYQKVHQDPNGMETGPPVYTNLSNQHLQPGTFSEMPSSPTMTNQTHNSMYGSQQPISEIDGSNSVAPSSPLVGGAAHAQRKSIGTNSLVSGSAGDRNELESTSTSAPQTQAAQTSQAGPTGAGPSAAASSQPQSQSGLGFQAGPVSDWNRPYHELE